MVNKIVNAPSGARVRYPRRGRVDIAPGSDIPSSMPTPLRRGLYVVKCYSPEKGVWHRAIADSGNVLGLLGARERFDHPYAVVIIDLTSAGLRAAMLPDGLTEVWAIVEPVANEVEAIARFTWARNNQHSLRYDVLLKNCEHFASYIATGKPESPQVQEAVGWAGVAAFVIWLLAA